MCDIDFDIFNDSPMVVRPKINIGFEHQAQIPECSPVYVEPDHFKRQSENMATLRMWDPAVNSNEKDIQRFIELAKSSAVPLGAHSEEAALKALLDANGEVHIAVLSLLQTPTTAIYKRWSSSEMQVFVRGLETYGKDFFRIAQDLAGKSTADCVQLYYFWKKLCHDYKTAHLFQPNSGHHHHATKAFESDEPPVQSHVYHHHHQPQNSNNSSHSSEIRPHLCEVPDCSAVSKSIV
jgi:hypothetical protein